MPTFYKRTRPHVVLIPALLFFSAAVGTARPAEAGGGAPPAARKRNEKKKLREVPLSQDRRKRVALVVGCAGYRHSDPLRNTLNDADDVTAVLRRCGFEVTLVKEPTKQKMVEAISAFGARLSPDSVALFYYSGHGAQINGRNYLIPVDFAAKSEAQAGFDAVEADRVLAEMDEAKSSLNVVILDACRDNPFAKSWRGAKSGGRGPSGLTQMVAPSGTLVAYATAPGKTASDNGGGRNGLFTQELLKAMQARGQKLQDVFEHVKVAVAKASGREQEPWTQAGPLEGAFYFLPDGAAPPVVRVDPPSMPNTPTEQQANKEKGPAAGTATRPSDDPAQEGTGETDRSATSSRTETKVVHSHTRIEEEVIRVRTHPSEADYVEAQRAVADADWQTAARLLPSYAERNDRWAQAQLGLLLLTGSGGVRKDERAAERWLRKAADQNEPAGHRGLAALYEQGRGGLKKDTAEAVRRYTEAAKWGDAPARSILGRMYEYGQGGLQKDLSKARIWYRLAAAGGDTVATEALRRLQSGRAPK